MEGRNKRFGTENQRQPEKGTNDPRNGERVTKGRVSLADVGEFWEFMFNPGTIRDQKGIAYPDQAVPGMSHPVTQFAGGGARMVTFELYLDGDRGRVGRGQAGALLNAARPPQLLRPGESSRTSKQEQINAPSKSIRDEILFWQSLQYPTVTDGVGMADVHPPVLLFTFGTLFTGLVCVLERCDVTVDYWNIDLEPVRATLGISLKEKVNRSVTRSTIYSRGNGQ
jgi:hypothetical protein